MAEWLKARASKACIPLRVSGVRIPLSPPLCLSCLFSRRVGQTGKYYVRVAGTNPDRFVTVWLEDGIPIQTGVEMSEPELRAALAVNGRTEAGIEQVIDAARDQAA